MKFEVGEKGNNYKNTIFFSLVLFLSLFNCLSCNVVCENLGKFEKNREGSPTKFFPLLECNFINLKVDNRTAIVIILTSEKYAAVARKTCGNFNNGWTYAEIKSCEVYSTG